MMLRDAGAHGLTPVVKKLTPVVKKLTPVVKKSVAGQPEVWWPGSWRYGGRTAKDTVAGHPEVRWPGS